MNRDEQIIAEAKKHYYDDINCYNAFLHGVEWADEHPADVWHDVSEEPIVNSTQIVYQDKSGICWFASNQERFEYDWDWERMAAAFQMTRWAYIRDLLPKEVSDDNRRQGTLFF